MLFPALAEKFLQRGVDVFLVIYPHAYEPLLVLQPILEDRKQRARGAPVARSPFLADLAIPEQVASRDQFIRQSYRLVVVGVVIVPVREVERIYIPIPRREAFRDHVKREPVGGRHDRPARLALREELLL